MAGWLVLTVMVIYFVIGTLYFKDGNIGLGITFIAYGISNFGLYLAGNSL